MTTFLLRAREFAIKAHTGQVRKYTNDHYYIHLMEVMGTVACSVDDPELMAAACIPLNQNILAAALLHDVLEDTDTTLDQLRKEFGGAVAFLVHELTNKATPEMGDRAARKKWEAERLGRTSAHTQTIKLADLISNTASIAKHDPVFMRVYGKEKRYLLECMKDGDKNLWAVADAQLRDLGY